jgi:nucleotide-binding universal stress UspA family protein
MKELKNILIAYDGSYYADDAIEDLHRAGLPAEVKATIVSVSEIWIPEHLDEDEEEMLDEGTVVVSPWRTRAEQSVEQARANAKQTAERIAWNFPHWQIDTKVMTDSPSWAILSVADEIQPDLIVVGSRGRSALARLLLGSVSQKVLTEAHCSVRIGRTHDAVKGSPARIVLGMDGSPDSGAVVNALLGRAWLPGSAVRVIAVLDAVGTALSAVPEAGQFNIDLYEEERTRLEHLVARAAAQLHEGGLVAVAKVEEGSPVRVLLKSAEEWGADSIFVGAQGARKRFLLGSVASAIAARAHCSVEVVRDR